MSDPLPAKMKCPKCGKIVQFPASKVGKLAKCPGCTEALTLVNQLIKAAESSPPPSSRTVATLPPPIPEAQPVDSAVTRTQVVQPAVDQWHLTATDGVQRQTARDGASRFMADGQDPGMIQKLLDRVQQICTTSEEVLYMAVQQRPIANFAPDAVVLTNRRAIIFRQKIMGRLEFRDCTWLQIAGVHMKENMIGASISVRGYSGHAEVVDYLPKVQARRVYRIGQEMEEEMIEQRRRRKMEEDRNAANQININTAVASPVPAAPTVNSNQGDLVARLSQLKQMLEAGLITDAEFQSKKASIMDSI